MKKPYSVSLTILLILSIVFPVLSCAQDNLLRGSQKIIKADKYIKLIPRHDTTEISMNDTAYIWQIGDSLYFQDASGTFSLRALASGSGGGTGTVDGTGALGRITIWLDANTLTSDADYFIRDTAFTLLSSYSGSYSGIYSDADYGSGGGATASAWLYSYKSSNVATISASSNSTISEAYIAADTVKINGDGISLDGRVWIPDFADTDSNFVWSDFNGKLHIIAREAMPDWVFNYRWSFRDHMKYARKHNSLPLTYKDNKTGEIKTTGQLTKPFSTSDEQLLFEIETNWIGDQNLRRCIIAGFVFILLVVMIQQYQISKLRRK